MISKKIYGTAFVVLMISMLTTTMAIATVNACHFTPGYWKNDRKHLWPVTSLTIGGVTYTKAQLLVILRTPPRGDATHILAFQLIAAKLNQLPPTYGYYTPLTDITCWPAYGGSVSNPTVVDYADWLLELYPRGSDPQGDARALIIEVAAYLDTYNNMP